MVSPGLQPPHPPENPCGLPVFRPQGLTFPFPPTWTIKLQVGDGTWSAQRGAVVRVAATEGALFALVVEAERLEAQRYLARL